MLIDFVVRSKEELPYRRAITESGIDCVVFDVNDSAFARALDAEGIIGVPGVALTHETSFLMALPIEAPESGLDTIEAWQDTIGEMNGIAVASHPYDRENGRPWGDRIYKLKGECLRPASYRKPIAKSAGRTGSSKARLRAPHFFFG